MNTKMTRRPPQPPIDAALVTRGAEFQKNRARDIGKPPVIVIVDGVYAADDCPPVVHYHYKEGGRRGSMPLADFCAGSEHKIPDMPPTQDEPDEPAPVSGVQPAPSDVDRLARIEAKIDNLIALANAGPLFARGQR